MIDATQPTGEIEEDDNDETKILEPLELTDRDIALFKLAHEHRFIVYSQIKEGFWKNVSLESKTCNKRIERLVKSGYLSSKRSERKDINAYFATSKSLKILRARGLDSGLELYQVSEYFDRNIDHDLKVLNLRILFRDLGLDSWIPERVVLEREKQRKTPDGVLTRNGMRVALEFENDGLTKDKGRYQGMLNYYRDHEVYDLLFLIVDGPIKDWLVFEMNYDSRRQWFTTYRELQQNRGNAYFENRSGHFLLNYILPGS